ncbi:MAG: TetR family transcriptional regulator [Acidobacteria bacterium]|nr:TetR family transcriptional regulator [Acidobacteriota bacterium]
MSDKSIDKKKRDKASTREALIGAATELFAERGFDGTRVDQIAQSAGVNKAMISYHFGGKKRLYNEILAATLNDAHERFHEIRYSKESADRRLRDFIFAFADLAATQPALPVMVIREVLSGGLHIDEDLLPRFLELFKLVQGIIDQGIREGTFTNVNSYVTHLSLLGSLVFFFATKQMRELLAGSPLPSRVPEVREFVRDLERTMRRGLAAGPAEA